MKNLLQPSQPKSKRQRSAQRWTHWGILAILVTCCAVYPQDPRAKEEKPVAPVEKLPEEIPASYYSVNGRRNPFTSKIVHHTEIKPGAEPTGVGTARVWMPQVDATFNLSGTQIAIINGKRCEIGKPVTFVDSGETHQLILRSVGKEQVVVEIDGKRTAILKVQRASLPEADPAAKKGPKGKGDEPKE